MVLDFFDLSVIRQHDAKVIEINPIPTSPHPLHNFIRFWGRLPDYLLNDLINQFEGSKILFDPFGGSGSVIFRGMDNNFSKIIYNDLNPTFTFIAKTLYDGLNLPKSELEENIKKLKEELLSDPTILDLSKIGGGSSFIYKFAYRQIVTLKRREKTIGLEFQEKVLNDLSKEIIRVLKRRKVMEFSELREKTIACLGSKHYSKISARSIFSLVLNRLAKKGVIKKETKRNYVVLSASIILPKDAKVLRINERLNKKFEKKEKKYEQLINRNVFSYPLRYFNRNQFRKAEGAKTLGELYADWSKILLSRIWKKIIEFPVNDKNLTNVFKLCFLASLYDSSKMQMPHKSGWIIKSFWVPPVCGTKNPLYVFMKKLNNFLLIHESIKKEGNCRTKVLFLNKDIQELNGEILGDKPDLVITHPPYFSTIQYGELSAIWAPWLGYKIPFEKEIVENYRQNKTKGEYLAMLKKSLEKISHLSKKNAKIVLIFQSKDKKEWELLDKEVLLKLPFKLEQIRCYKRRSRWGSKHLFNVGDYDYVFVFKNIGG